MKFTNVIDALDFFFKSKTCNLKSKICNKKSKILLKIKNSFLKSMLLPREYFLNRLPHSRRVVNKKWKESIRILRNGGGQRFCYGSALEKKIPKFCYEGRGKV